MSCQSTSFIFWKETSLRIPWIRGVSTGVIDKDVNFTEVVQGSLYDFISELNWVVVGYGNSSFGLDLLYDEVGSGGVISFSYRWGAEVIDDNFGSTTGKEEGIGLSESSSGTGDDDDFIVELKSHVCVFR